MAPKPSSLPRWANVGGKIVEPPSGKKDVGWVGEEKMPEGFVNWLMNLAYQWFVYVNDGDLEHITFTRAHAFHGTTHVRVGTFTTLVDGRVRLSTGLHEFGAPVNGYRVGDTLESIRFRVKDDGAFALRCAVRKIDAAGTDTELAFATSSAGGVWEWVVVDFADQVIAAGDRFMVTVKDDEGSGAATGNMDSSMFEVSHKRG